MARHTADYIDSRHHDISGTCHVIKMLMNTISSMLYKTVNNLLLQPQLEWYHLIQGFKTHPLPITLDEMQGIVG